jgi:hypoxanthine-DNA glycosylase
MKEIQTHPHKMFVPLNSTILILGTFPGKSNVQVEGKDEWFYSSKRNQFWSIIRSVYKEELKTTTEKKALFKRKGIAIGDIFLKIKRKENNNSDTSIEVIEYNDKEIEKALKENTFRSIYTTSQFVEKEFKKLFPDWKNTEALPSPSPRHARMTLEEKIAYYKKKLPP